MNNIKKIKKANEFTHNMIKEIFEQPAVIEKLIAEHVNLRQKKVIFKEFGILAKKIKKINRILFLACGSSYHAGIIGKYMLEEYAGLASEVEFADEFISRKIKLDNKTLVIVISQSGATKDDIKAVKKAKKQKALVISITNKVNSKLDNIDDITIYNLAGEEKALAATKTFTSQIVLMAFLTIYIGQSLRKISPVTRGRLIREITRLPDKINKILKQNINFQIIANKYYKLNNLLILGKNYQYPIAMEAALKFKETTYIHAEGFAAGEFAHGPLAISGRKHLCMVFAPIDSNYKETKQLIKKLKSLKIKIIALTNQGNRQLIRYTDRAIYVPKTLNLFTPIISIVPIQLLVYHVAVLKGINPDKSRNLKKFVE
ncbi:MAG: SIS domain-containing protein [candidate division Zixibacteria bacterium]|nr:SIS domain-containing protein [candidate division Zixibacteria bacterium]